MAVYLQPTFSYNETILPAGGSVGAVYKDVAIRDHSVVAGYLQCTCSVPAVLEVDLWCKKNT